MYQTIVVLKALAEIAALALVGQGVLFILAGPQREKNLFYGILRTVTSPVMRAARFLSPRFVLDQHIWLVAFFLVALAWVLLTFVKISLALDARA